MERKEYSAGAVKFSFWFMEFRKVVEYCSNGNSMEDIKRLSAEENFFAAPTPARGKQICSTVTMRVQALAPDFYPVFLGSDLSTQKLFNLVGVMASDTLFFDFVYEVVREKMIIGSNELTDADIRVFFKDKQVQDEKVAGWTDMTLNRLGRCYKNMLYEAGVTDKGRDVRKIYRPLLDPVFENWLLNHDMAIVVKALTGVR